jgi:hypothetical protein
MYKTTIILIPSQSYKSNQRKIYSSEYEESERFATYLENLKLIDQRNLLEGAMIHGETIFSDLSLSEFEAFLALRPTKFDSSSADDNVDHSSTMIAKNRFHQRESLLHKDFSATISHGISGPSPQLQSPLNFTRLVDWSTGPTIYVTPIKNQVIFRIANKSIHFKAISYTFLNAGMSCSGIGSMWQLFYRFRTDTDGK